MHRRLAHLLPIPGKPAEVADPRTVAEAGPRDHHHRERCSIVRRAGGNRLDGRCCATDPRAGRVGHHKTVAAVGSGPILYRVPGIAEKHFDSGYFGEALKQEEQSVERGTFCGNPLRIDEKDTRCLRVSRHRRARGCHRVEREPDERIP